MKLLILPILPAIPLIVWLLGGAAAVATLAFVGTSLWGKDDKLSICALGPNFSGKTLFFNALRGRYIPTAQTLCDEINEFEYRLSNGKTIKFAKTVDFNGDPDFIKSNYKKVLLGKNRVIFFCNIYDYLNNVNYERDVNARLDYIRKIMKDFYMPVENMHIILSYADKYSDRNDVIRSFQRKIGSKANYGEFSTHVDAAVNMTNSEEVKTLINNLFS